MPSSFVQTVTSQTMNLDVTKMLGIKRDVTALCTDLFLIIIRMREAEDLGDPAALRKLITYYISLFEKNCKAIGMDPESAAEAKYAIVALMDETVLSVPGACRDYWISRPMQLDYFGDNIAGQEFFEKLQKLLLTPENKKHVLEVFFLCLALGFEGKYKMFNPGERIAIMEDLGRKIRRTRIRVSSDLSPHGKRPESSTEKRAKAFLFPLWLSAGLAAAAMIVCWIVLYFVNNSAAQALLSSIQTLAAR
ncbi:MAG TPA: type IVB secretion system protein IcmH/DotU [Chitinivibrionales bacterium]|nr:type IVB secretion system protein IcmH/DotU [Chitinivibrionales bacterium]